MRKRIWAGVVTAGLWNGEAIAQDASLLLAPLPQQEGQSTLQNSSFTYRKLPPEAEYR
jgi:hypothetical protein